MGRRVYIDAEGDGLLDTISKLWCLVAKDVDTGEVFCFHPKLRTACQTCNGTGSVTELTDEFFGTTSVKLCPTCEGSRTSYGDHSEWKDDFKDFLTECDLIIGHNLIGYDVPAIKKVLGIGIPLEKIVDTLVLSRLFRPVTPPNGVINGARLNFTSTNNKPYADNRKGGHSLDAWGQRLGYPKQYFDDWSKYSPKMLAYCVNDVQLGHRIWEYLEQERLGLVDPAYLTGAISKPVPFSDFSIRLEHKVAACLQLQMENGFFLDTSAAEELRDETEEMLKVMDKDVVKFFPPIEKFVKHWEPKFKKDGSLTAASEKILKNWICKPQAGLGKPIKLSDGTTLTVFPRYDLYEKQEFNPRSGQQIGRRLMDLGWVPKKFTPTGQPATDKETLQEAVRELKASHPEVEFLESYNLVAYNNDKAKKWLEIKHNDSRVYGRINHMGAGTHRCTHSDDNMANIASVVVGSDGTPLKGLDGNFGYDCRRCWSVPNGSVLVGADASGIQLRALAHYMDDPSYTKALLEADIHVVNQKAAGIKDRPTAKTFIYAWLLGAGDLKIGEIVGVDPSEYNDLLLYGRTEYLYGKPLVETVKNRILKMKLPLQKSIVCKFIKGYKTKKQFLDRTPALKRLRTKDIPEATKTGYVVGLDGRKLWIPSEHLAMSLYLQGFEAVAMKAAINIYHHKLNAQNVPFKQVAFVHDEVQVETLPEYADQVGQVIVQSIKDAGKLLKSNCPLDGEYKVGANWAETH